MSWMRYAIAVPGLLGFSVIACRSPHHAAPRVVDSAAPRQATTGGTSQETPPPAPAACPPVDVRAADAADASPRPAETTEDIEAAAAADAARRDGCTEDGGGAPTCLWKRFARVRARKDATIKMNLLVTGCPEPEMIRALQGLSRTPLATLRSGSWMGDMAAHCAAELHECEVHGVIEADDETIAFRINHEGMGSVRQHGQWAHFSSGRGGGCDG